MSGIYHAELLFQVSNFVHLVTAVVVSNSVLPESGHSHSSLEASEIGSRRLASSVAIRKLVGGVDPSRQKLLITVRTLQNYSGGIDVISIFVTSTKGSCEAEEDGGTTFRQE